jgi:hypothetical protein
MNRSPHGRVRRAARVLVPVEAPQAAARPQFLVELERPNHDDETAPRLLGPGVIHLHGVTFAVGVVELSEHGSIYCLLDRESLTGELVVDTESRGWEQDELGHLVPVLVGVAEPQGITLCCTIGARVTEDRRQTVIARPARHLRGALPHARLDDKR